MPVNDESTADERLNQFVMLYTSHHQRIYLYLVSLLPNRAHAEDLLQETSLVLWRKFDQYQPDTNFLAWAFQIARIAVLQHYARSARDWTVLDQGVLEQIADRVPQYDSEQENRRRTALLQCLEKLSERDRSLVTQRYQPGATGNSVAQALGRSPNAVAQSLGRIRRLLSACIERTLSCEDRSPGDGS